MASSVVIRIRPLMAVEKGRGLLDDEGNKRPSPPHWVVKDADNDDNLSDSGDPTSVNCDDHGDDCDDDNDENVFDVVETWMRVIKLGNALST